VVVDSLRGHEIGSNKEMVRAIRETPYSKVAAPGILVDVDKGDLNSS
jgi:hypothetical protein